MLHGLTHSFPTRRSSDLSRIRAMIKKMGRPTGFEPATSGTTNRRSNQLSYGRHTPGGQARRQRAAIGAHRPVRQALFARRSEEHTSELQSLMRISYAVFCLKKKKTNDKNHT